MKNKFLDILANIKPMLYNQEEKGNPYLKQLERLTFLYVNTMGKMIRDLTESPKNITKFATYDSNCFVLEFYLLILLEAFRRSLVTNVFSHVYGIHKEFLEKLSTGEEFLESLGISNTFKINSSYSLAKVIDRSHKSFIKKKINLDPKVILTSEALLEFFVEGYPLTYNSNSFFCSKYYKCQGHDKDFKEPCIIIVDCIDNLVCLKYDVSVFDKKLDDLQLKNWARQNVRFVMHISEAKMIFREQKLTFSLSPINAYSNEQAVTYTFLADDKQALDYIRSQLETLASAKSKLRA